MSDIRLCGVTKRLGDTPVLTGVNLSVPDGSITAVLGASGSGKTTLLRVVAGFERVDTGRVWLGGQVVDDGHAGVRAQHRRVGYVAQEGALFPHLTVRGNIGFGLPRRTRLARAERAARVEQLLELIGLAELGRRFPHQLSGGQQQRVALARALAVRPSVVLLDEPFSSLDAALRTEVRRDVLRILAEAKATSLLVTHDQDEALALADQVALLRDGKVVACADPQSLYHRPPDPCTARFVGAANLLPAVVRAGRAHSPLGELTLQPDPDPPPDGPSQLLVRPEQVALRARAVPDAVRASVLAHQFHGHDALVRLALDSATPCEVVARVPGNLDIETGQVVWLQVHGPVSAWPTGESAQRTARGTQ